MPEGDTSYGVKLGYELIVFYTVSYLAVFFVYGRQLMGTFYAASPGSAGASSSLFGAFIGIINFILNVVTTILSLFTFNIPGIPTELRLIFSFLYTGILIVCILIFYDRIKDFFITAINAVIFVFNITLGNVPFIGKMDFIRH